MQHLFTQMLNSVTCGDCVDVLSFLPSACVDFVLTDPPFVANFRDRSGRTVLNDHSTGWMEPAFREIYGMLRSNTFCVSFYSWHKADTFLRAWRAAGFHVVGHIVFRKPYASSVRHLQYHHEQAYLLAKGRPPPPQRPIADVIESWTYTGNRLHPTQKPLDALEPLIDTFSGPGDVVLDPFAGSGSTLVAARRLGRRYLGVELDPEHHRSAIDRLART